MNTTSTNQGGAKTAPGRSRAELDAIGAGARSYGSASTFRAGHSRTDARSAPTR